MTNTFATTADQNALAAIFFKRWSSLMSLNYSEEWVFEQLGADGVVPPQYTAFAGKVLKRYRANKKLNWWQNRQPQPEPVVVRNDATADAQERERYDRQMLEWQKVPCWAYIIDEIREQETLFSPYVLAVFGGAYGRNKDALQTLFSTYGFEQGIAAEW